MRTLFAALLLLMLAACQPTKGTVVTAPDVYALSVVARSFSTVLGRPVADAEGPSWYQLALDHPDAEWVATWMMASPEYQEGMGLLSDAVFIDHGYQTGFGRSSNETEQQLWQGKFARGEGSRATFAAWIIEQGFGAPLVRPTFGVACWGFVAAGPAPRCSPGGDGSPGQVLVRNVTGTNIVANVSWADQVGPSNGA